LGIYSEERGQGSTFSSCFDVALRQFLYSAYPDQVMEFCGGGDLAGYYTEKEFNNQEYARVCKEMLSACAYLHERSIAHRDLKPENVLLETGTRRVKLADFGLAKKNRNTVTRGVGTPSYMVCIIGVLSRSLTHFFKNLFLWTAPRGSLFLPIFFLLLVRVFFIVTFIFCFFFSK
jgi:hypothetical protein